MELNEYHKQRNIKVIEELKLQQGHTLTLEEVEAQFKRIREASNKAKNKGFTNNSDLFPLPSS